MLENSGGAVADPELGVGPFCDWPNSAGRSGMMM